MAYTSLITRRHPSCLLFLVDQSASMDEVMNPEDVRPLERPVHQDGVTYTHKARGKTKARAVADAVNRLLQELVLKCAKSEGVRDYYHVGVIGYGGDGTAGRVGSAFGGALSGRLLVPISAIADSPDRVDVRVRRQDDGAGGLVERRVKFPVWFDAVAAGGTPMCAALRVARGVLADWVGEHAGSFPPICINITDGESTDGNPTADAGAIGSLQGHDGVPLLFNIHISARPGVAVEFPDSGVGLADPDARRLFDLSSRLPAGMLSVARDAGFAVADGARGFAYNADLALLIQFLNIGTGTKNIALR